MFEAAMAMAAADIAGRPRATRREWSRWAKRMAMRHARVARSDEVMAATSSLTGVTVGGGLLTTSLVSVLTAPFSLPMLLVACGGGIVLAAGVAGHHILQQRKVHQLDCADQYNWLAEETDQ